MNPKPKHALFVSTFSTPLGPFSVAVDESGAIVATAFGDRARLEERLGDGEKSRQLLDDAPRCAAVRTQVFEYFDGVRRTFTLPLAPRGSAFQRRVWSALRAIPCGETRSYGVLARKLHTSARAVGRANATNPVCLIVPCHRVIGADGSLTGFAFGEDLKQRLLAHEGVHTAS